MSIDRLYKVALEEREKALVLRDGKAWSHWNHFYKWLREDGAHRGGDAEDIYQLLLIRRHGNDRPTDHAVIRDYRVRTVESCDLLLDILQPTIARIKWEYNRALSQLSPDQRRLLCVSDITTTDVIEKDYPRRTA